MTFPNLQPLAASADPDSSRVAGEQLTASGSQDRQKHEVLTALSKLNAEHVYPTSLEMSNLTGMDRHLLARRLPDLMHDRLVDQIKVDKKPVRWMVKL